MPNDNGNDNGDKDLLAALVRIEQLLSAQATTPAAGDAAATDTTGARVGAEQRVEQLEKEVSLRQRVVDSYEKTIKSSGLDLDYIVQKNEQLRESVRHKREELQQALQGEEVAGKHVSLAKEKYKELANGIKVVEREAEMWKILHKEAEIFNVSLEKSVAAAEGLGTSLGGAFQVFGSTKATETLKSITKAVQGGRVGLLAFTSGLTTGVLSSFTNSVIGLAFAIMDAENQFRKATGASQEFASSMMDTFHATKQYGVSIEDASAAHTALFNTYTDFTFQNEEVRQSLGQTIAVLGKLGVSAENAAKSVQFMTKAMGILPDQADEALLGLKEFAVEIGVAPSRITEGFAGATTQLSKFGNEGMKAFKGVAIQSKLTGMEIPKILALVEKFDTFEGAAEQAGMLNAALGGNFVNAMDLMMEEDPAARFDMIRDAISQTGLSFNEMSYQQRLFYTEALKLGDVSELALVMSGRTDLLGDSMNQTEEDFQKAAEEALAYATAQEQLKALLVILVPVMTSLVEGLRGIFKWVGENTAAMKLLVPPILIFMAILKLVTISTAIFGVTTAAAFAPWIAGIAVLLAVGAAITGVWYAISKKRSSPTFLEGLSLMAGLVDKIGLGAKNARRGIGMMGDSAAKAGDQFTREHSLSYVAALEVQAATFDDMATSAPAAARGVGNLGYAAAEYNVKRTMAPAQRAAGTTTTAADTTGAPSILRATFALALDGAATKDLLEGAVANVVVDGILQTA